MQEEQKGIEADAGKNYPEPNVIPMTLEDLYNDCKQMVDDCKKVKKDIEDVRAGQSKDVGKAMQPICDKLLSLDKRILALAEKLEELAKKVLKNGEDLRSKEKFPPDLKVKFNKVGKKFENIGVRLQNIGKNFGIIGYKMGSIGKRIGGDEGSKLTKCSDELKDLADKAKVKGGHVEELGHKIQKLEPNVRDEGTDKDLEDMLKALDGIIQDLEAIMKVTLIYCRVKTSTLV